QEGDAYHELRPTISICFLDAKLFAEVPDYHLRFRLWDDGHRVMFTEDQEIHLLELPKFAVPADKLASPLEAWLYFLRHGATLDSEALPAAFDRPAIQQAMEVLNVMTQSELERERYEARRKHQHDQVSLLLAAEQRGRAEGKAEG